MAKISSLVRRIGLSLGSSLVARKLEQFSLASFEECHRDAKRVYREIPSVNKTEFSSFVHPLWKEFEGAVADYFLGSDFKWSFLRQPIFGRTMFVRAGGRWQREQLRFLRSVAPDTKLLRLLRENKLGNPYITSLQMLTSHNTIHHLYHLLRYEQVTKTTLQSIDSVVEFGGGYGNLARLVRKLNANLTYAIIDLPIFSCIQMVYLGAIFGRDGIHLVDETGQLNAHKINLLPLPFLCRASNLRCQLFISTWALSECSQVAQHYVAKRSFFGARHLLLAYQLHNALFGPPDKSLTQPPDFAVIHERIPFMTNAHYMFA